MEFLDAYLVTPINNLLWSYVLIYMLIIAGIYFTIRTKFVQFRFIPHMIKLLTESTKTQTHEKSISSFKAYCIGLASRVGTGNISGVAMAIALGGPGAVFWMWIVALLGASSAFIESTLAQIYKVKDGKFFRGGPAYYMRQGLKCKWMSVLFAVLMIASYGFIFNSVQSNAISYAFQKATGTELWITGLITAIATAMVIFGGVRRIAVASEIIVPIMALAYIGVVFYAVITHLPLIPKMIMHIFESAFGIQQAAGGVIGITIKRAMDMGIRRGLFSNEAGMGSAPNAAAAALVSHPVKQGLIQALGVFTDTIVICTATAFIVLLGGIYGSSEWQGVQLTQESLSLLVGRWGDLFIACCIVLFAFTSIIGNYYYGETNVEYLSSNKKTLLIYRSGVILMVFYGAIQQLSVVWNFADLIMGLMAVTNIVAITLLSKIAIDALYDYISQLKEGKNPVFYRNSIRETEFVECWEDKK